MKRVSKTLMLITAVLVLIGGCRMQSPLGRTRTPSSPRHVFLITVDTLRADAVSARVGDRSSTPAMDAFALDSVVFDNTVAPASWTVPSVASILTGQPVAVHQVTEDNSRVPRSLPSIGSEMRRAGYASVAAGYNTFLRPGPHGRERGFQYGFDEYHFPVQRWFGDHGVPLPSAGFRNETYDKKFLYNSTVPLETFVLSWLDEHASEDFFFWIHFMDPHAPYNPPPPFKPDGVPGRIQHMAHATERIQSALPELSKKHRRDISRLYAGEVRFVDESFGRIIDKIRQKGIYDESLIVFSSDHGEELFERDWTGHGHSMHEEVLHVPLMVKLPASYSSRVFFSDDSLAVDGRFVTGTRSETVSTLGIMPFILETCGLGHRVRDLSDNSLSPWLGLGSGTGRQMPVFSGGVRYGAHLESVIFEGYKYIRRPATGEGWLYDIESDPTEQTSILDDHPGLEEHARNLLDAHLASSARVASTFGIDPEDRLELDQETIEALEALGYLQK